MHAAALLDRTAAAWRDATRHPFLLGVRDGSVPPAAFDTWLAQDALFVADLLSFQARLLARAPRPAQAVLAAGCVALVQELDWFEGLGARRGLALDVAPLPATVAYGQLLERLDAGAYEVAATALWALERTYLQAWAVAAPGAPEFRECVEHWTAPGFDAYVAQLETLAEQVLAGPYAAEAEVAVTEVLAAEVAFWDTALPSEQGR